METKDCGVFALAQMSLDCGRSRSWGLGDECGEPAAEKPISLLLLWLMRGQRWAEFGCWRLEFTQGQPRKLSLQN